MAFITNSVYMEDSTNPFAVKPLINHELFELSADFCNTYLYLYEYAMYRLVSSTYWFLDHPYFVVDNDFYIAGMVGDPTNSSDTNIHFNIYHMDSNTYTNATIPYTWSSRASYEDVSDNYVGYYVIIPIKQIEDLRFYAFVVYLNINSYNTGGATSSKFIIIDYKNLSVTNISEPVYKNYWKYFTLADGTVMLGSWKNPSATTDELYIIDTSTGAFTHWGYTSSNLCITAPESETPGGISGYSNYYNGDYCMYWSVYLDINNINSSNSISDVRGEISNKGRYANTSEYSRVVPVRMRTDQSLAIFINCYQGRPQCILMRIDGIEADPDDSNTLKVKLTYIENLDIINYYNGNLFTLSNVTGIYKSQITMNYVRPPMIMDYSKKNTFWALPLDLYSKLQWSSGDTGPWYRSLPIMKYTLNEEDK